MKRIVMYIVLLLTPCTVVMAQTTIGSTINSFSIETGDGKKMVSSDLSGRLTVLFYETKDNKELNRLLKTRLNTLFNSLDDNDKKNIIRLPVIDCSGAFWPFTNIWKKQLVENSKIEEMDVYGDWDGNMKKKFLFEDNEVYFVIIDQKLAVCFFEKGKLNQNKIDQAVNVLISQLHINR